MNRGDLNNLINLIREWLVGISFYVQDGDDCSEMFDSDVGTIQGSVLGPIVYALFVSPLFDLTQLTNFADEWLCIMLDSYFTQKLSRSNFK